jgi:hypothetical protein
MDSERIERLGEIIIELKELMAEFDEIAQDGSRSIYERFKAYPLGHIICAIDADHDYLSREITLQDIADELEEEDGDDDGDEEEADDPAEAIRATADAIGGEVYEGYSGRGMMGAKCWGISCDDATQAIEEAASRGLRGAQRDSLGKGYIIYWPNIPAE